MEIFNLGIIDYQKARDFQREIFIAVKQAKYPAGLILCQHNPIITLGRQAKKENVLLPEQELKSKNIQVCQIERGGDVTYHGLGQLTAYPIFDLNCFKKDIHWFLRQLEGIIIKLIANYGVSGQRRSGLTGVWIGEKKIASIGIAVRNWITYHGLSINVKSDDLENFCLIRPCGMDIEMTSLESEANMRIKIDDVKKDLIRIFKEVVK